MKVITYSQLTELQKHDYKSWLKLSKKVRNEYIKQPFKAVLFNQSKIMVLRDL